MTYITKHRRKILIVLGVLIVIRCFYAQYLVGRNSRSRIYDTIEAVPPGQTILLLGTSPTLADGRNNLFYTYRIQAVVDLRNANKIDHILISGDNSRENYNEPEAMKKSLMQAGIPENLIKMDYAGFRTLDSVMRARDVFEKDDLLVVSQQFHIERAITIGSYRGIHLTGYPARDVAAQVAPRIYLRELLARMWMILDLFIFDTKPHFPQ